jgi:putative transposase
MPRLDHHLVNGEPGNSRNGYGRKTVTTGTGRIELEIPRDRAGSFDPARDCQEFRVRAGG